MAENVRRSIYRYQGATSRDSRGRLVATIPEPDRFWQKVQLARGNDCWLWLAGTNKFGYGTFRRTLAAGEYRTVLAHRYAYEQMLGPIPEDTLDHLCETKTCVRPSHLDPVSNAENLSRRHARRRARLETAA